MNRRAKAWQSQYIDNTNDLQKKYRLGTVSKHILLEGINLFHSANLTFDSDVDQDSFGKVTKHNTHTTAKMSAADHKATKIRHTVTTHPNMKHN